MFVGWEEVERAKTRLCPSALAYRLISRHELRRSGVGAFMKGSVAAMHGFGYFSIALVGSVLRTIVSYDKQVRSE